MNLRRIKLKKEKYKNIISVSTLIRKGIKVFRKRLIGTLFICIISFLFINTVTADVYQNYETVLESDEEYSTKLDQVEEDEEITFDLDADGDICVYIIDEIEYGKRHLYGFNRSDFNKQDIKDITFNWTKPDDKNYLLVLENNNDFSVGVNFTYHTKDLDINILRTELVQNMMCCCFGVSIVVLIIIVSIVMYMKD